MRRINLEQSIERILEEQTKDGLFITYRAKNPNDLTKRIEERQEQKIENIGIHAYILGKLANLREKNLRLDISFQRGLGRLVEEAINYNGEYLWRWLKEPNRPDYLYTPDHDDTARAIATIELARVHYPRLFEYLNDKYEKILQRDYSTLLSEELVDKEGLVTFITRYGNKKNNDVDPVVNAHVLYAYLSWLRNKGKQITNDKTACKISNFLSKFILSNEFNKDFREISKFYLTPTLMANVIADITLIEPRIFDTKVTERMKNRMIDSLQNSPNVFETAKATSTLIKLNYSGKEVKSGIDEIIEKSEGGIWPAYPFYQHQRLGDVFGSKAGTSVFCIEALRKYDNLLK